MTHHTMSRCFSMELVCQKVCGSTMKDRSDDPSHHEQVFLNGAGVCQKVCGSTMKDRSDDPSHHEQVFFNGAGVCQ